MDFLEMLKMLIANTDLEEYIEDDEKLEYAISYAKDEITARYGASDFDNVPAKYHRFVIEGAKWYLALVGAEGQSSMTENGVSRTYKETPDWLSHIIPKVGVVKKKRNATKTKTEDSLV
jgi:hypothetical protein